MDAIQKRLVFIVEDNEMYSLMLEYKLSNDSIVQCLGFKSGEECIEHMGLNPMLVILDYWLPGINGKETFEQIKKYNPKIPVVFLTRNEDEAVEKELIKAGAYDYLYKEDDSIQQVKKIINTFLDKISSNEQKGMTHLNIIFCLIFFIALFIVILYAYQ